MIDHVSDIAPAAAASAFIEISMEHDAIWITDIAAVLAAIADLDMEGRGRLFSDALAIMERNHRQRLKDRAEGLSDDEPTIISLNLNNPFVRSMFEAMHGPCPMTAVTGGGK